jgi:DNA-directed RNA polymerase subunit M/transcription elongation factor TFIIS
MNSSVRASEVCSALQGLLACHLVDIDAPALELELFELSAGDDWGYQQSLQQLLFSLSHEGLSFPRNCHKDAKQALVYLLSFCDSETRNRIDRATRIPARQKAEEGYMTCRCGSRRIEWEDRHIRSADEGATLFCACTDCGARWRISA